MDNQRVTNRLVKDALLHCKRRPFTRQKMPFYNAKDALLQCKTCPFTMQKGMFCFANYHFFLQPTPSFTS